jgi:lipopolysaccharide transport system ATP-binding protein
MRKKYPYAITLNNVSKNYNLYQSPSHRVMEVFHPFRKTYSKKFRAIKNISLDIKWGETVGMVGRNGCGKSTLLQLICGIMPPNDGEISVNGTISAILELGGGFDPEYTGRENIRLKCSIMGMQQNEIDQQIDEIIKFADINTHIDQPIKTYSSGMSVRLAFAVAISIHPDILVVDEALAVGDAAFQRKCSARIKTIQENGATVLFVSHDAGAVVELCSRAVLIDQGEILYVGKPKDVVSLYHKLLFAPQDKVNSIRKQIVETIVSPQETIKKENVPLEKLNNTAQDKPSKLKPYFNPHLKPKSTTWYEQNGALIENPLLLTMEDEQVNSLVRGEYYQYSYEVTFTDNTFNVRFGMLIKTVSGFELGGHGKYSVNEHTEYFPAGTKTTIRFRFKCALLAGTYFLNAGVVGIVNKEEFFLHRGIDVAMFEVQKEAELGSTGIIDFSVEPNISYKISE